VSSVGDYDEAALAVMLRAGAAGLYTEEAAVELLLGHYGRQLTTKLAAYIEIGDDDRYAALDWARLSDDLAEGLFFASSGEACLVRLAASLGAGVPVTLRDVSALDHCNATLALQAIAHSCGWLEHHHSAAISGRFDPAGPTEPASSGGRL